MVLILAQLAAIACQLLGRSALLAGNIAERTTTHSGRLDCPMNQIEGSTSGLPASQRWRVRQMPVRTPGSLSDHSKWPGCRQHYKGRADSTIDR
jgi:hypothetical protein